MTRSTRLFFLLALLAGQSHAPAVLAAACTTAASGNWSSAATWNAPCNVVGGPVSTDTVTIGATHTVTLTANAAAASITVAAATAANGITLGGNTLTVGGNVTMTAVSTNLVTSTIAVGTGMLTLNSGGSITINGGAGKRVAQMTVSTGTITASGSINFGGTAGNAQLISTGASTINVGGNLGSGGTFTDSTGTVVFNGTGAQSVGPYTYNNLKIANTSAAVSGSTNFNVSGTLTVNANAVLTPAAAVVINSAAAAGTITGSGTVQVTRTAATADYSSQYQFTTNILTNLTVEYNGTTAQTVSAVAYGNLKIDNASGVTLPGSNVTVSNTLTLTNGVVTTSANTLITSANCPGSVSRTSGHVAGFLRLQIPTGSPTCTFDVGDSTTYRPINLTFTSVTTAGNLTGSASQTAGEHANISTSGLDSTQDVNRFWTLTNGGVVLSSYSATFNFVAGDVDTGADPLTFEVERWDGSAWNTTTAGTRTSTSTQATGITAFSDFASGKKKVTVVTPSSFNAFETSTAASAITGRIFTKLVGTGFSLDVVAISGGVQQVAFTNSVSVALVANTTGAGLGADNCPTTFTTVQGPTTVTITGGRSTVSFSAVATAYRDVRVRIQFPVAVPTVTSCSTDNFSIRPTGFIVSSTNANNTNTTGTPAIKTGANFNLTAASVAGYDGTPSVDNTKVVGTPTAGTIGGSFGAAPVGTGTATGASLFYSEVGNFGLNANAILDTSFTSVDQPNDCTADFSNTLVGGKYGCSFGSTAVAQTTGSSGFGRFIPDNFAASLNTPTFGTVCGTGTFSYVGQSFTYTTAPVITVTARNGTNNGLTNATTTNYAGAYMKITNASLTPSTQAARYSRFDALGGGATPALDSSGLPATTGDPAIGTFTAGVGTLAFGSGTGLLFTRSTTTPNAPFNADIALTLNVIDTDAVAFAGNPASFGAATAGNGIAFSSGKEMRFGRLRLFNASGSQLIAMPIPMSTQYWNGSGFVTNTADSCTSIALSNIVLGNYQKNLNAGETAATVGGAFSAGIGTLRLSAPGAANNGSVDVSVNLTGAPAGASCTSGMPASTGAGKMYLQGAWCGTTYVNDPTARATFGTYRNTDKFIYQQENF